MIVQLNLVAPQEVTSMRLAQILVDRLWAGAVKVRVEKSVYDALDGPVQKRVFIALAETGFPLDGVISTITDLAAELGLDYIAAKIDGAGMLLGPDAERWLPFNPLSFKDY